MKSRVHLKSHPLHPILVSFPIAFFTGTLLFDVAGLLLKRNDFHTTAIYLEIAGVGFALLAAVPGIIDYFFIVPPKSSAKNRALKHGFINIIMVIIFGLAFLLRKNGVVSLFTVIALETIGVIFLGIAGWLGGTLVYRNQIGGDIRYAHAGKWKDEYIDQASGEIPVAAIDELKINQMKLVHIKGKRIVICKTEKGYAAFDDHCTHRGGSLAGGSMICGTVQCPWHGSQFDVHTGITMAGPAQKNIAVYTIKEIDTSVFLILP